jgi:hypothetical protein
MNYEEYKKWYLADGTIKSESELVSGWIIDIRRWIGEEEIFYKIYYFLYQYLNKNCRFMTYLRNKSDTLVNRKVFKIITNKQNIKVYLKHYYGDVKEYKIEKDCIKISYGNLGNK